MLLLQHIKTRSMIFLACLQEKIHLLHDALSELLIVNKDSILDGRILSHDQPRVFILELLLVS